MTPQFVMSHAIDKSEPANIRHAESEIECLDYANGYAEPGYTDPEKCVLFADWNPFDRKLTDLLERYGYACEWSDEWSTCEDCGKAVRTSPDSYGWGPSYVILNECSIVCVKCLLDNDSAVEEYLKGMENRTSNAINIDIDPARYGYVELQHGFESGFHPGQNDDPKAIMRKLRETGETRPLVCKIDDRGQFDIGFSVWAKVSG
jgi:hypothetical protein